MPQVVKTATVMTCVRNGYTTTPTGYAVGGLGPSPSYNNSIYMTFPSFGLPEGSTITSASMHYDMTSWDYSTAMTINIACAVGAGTPTNQVATQGTADANAVPASTLKDTYVVTNTAQKMYLEGDYWLKMYAANGNNRKNFSSTKAIMTVNYTLPTVLEVSKDVNWDVTETIDAERITQWAVYSLAQRSQNMAWVVTGAVDKVGAIAWDVLEGVVASVSVAWDVASALLPLSVVKTLAWGVGGEVHKSLVSTWRTEVGLAHSVYRIKFWTRKNTDVKFEEEL